MTRIAPLEVKLRACDAQREDASSRLKVNLTELQGYFGGGGGTTCLDPPADDSVPFPGSSVCRVVERLQTAAAPLCV